MQGRETLRAESSRRLEIDPDKPETRGRKPILDRHHWAQIEEMYRLEGFESTSLPWAAVADAANVTPASESTIRRGARAELRRKKRKGK